MFSPGPAWREDKTKQQGCIVELNLAEFDPTRQRLVDAREHLVEERLAAPHNVMKHEGKLVYCESLAYRVVDGGVIIPFPGFTRGLCLDREFMFVGQSRMRHLGSRVEIASNSAIDAGVWVHHRRKRVSRFIPLPVREVYQIEIVDSTAVTAPSRIVMDLRSAG
jgi:hypothetical protein